MHMHMQPSEVNLLPRTTTPRCDVSRLLARGILRLHRRRLLGRATPSQEEVPESLRQGLEVSRETVLSVTSG